MMRFTLFALLLLFVLSGLSAQTAAELEALLESPSVSWAQGAAFVLRAAEAEDRALSPFQAFELARERGYVPRSITADDPLSLGGLSLLIMRSFNLKGGFMYSLFHGSRYACRELISLRIIGGKTDPAGPVSGDRLLYILGAALSRTGGGDAE
jgi:hypothetical protein